MKRWSYAFPHLNTFLPNLQPPFILEPALFELALWKFNLDQADATNTNNGNRAAYRIDVPGPVKDTILQYLDYNIWYRFNKSHHLLLGYKFNHWPWIWEMGNGCILFKFWAVTYCWPNIWLYGSMRIERLLLQISGHDTSEDVSDGFWRFYVVNVRCM